MVRTAWFTRRSLVAIAELRVGLAAGADHRAERVHQRTDVAGSAPAVVRIRIACVLAEPRRVLVLRGVRIGAAPRRRADDPQAGGIAGSGTAGKCRILGAEVDDPRTTAGAAGQVGALPELKRAGDGREIGRA